MGRDDTVARTQSRGGFGSAREGRKLVSAVQAERSGGLPQKKGIPGGHERSLRETRGGEDRMGRGGGGDRRKEAMRSRNRSAAYL